MQIIKDLIGDIWNLRIILDGFIPELLNTILGLLMLSGIIAFGILLWAFARVGWDILIECLEDNLGI